MTVAGGVLIGLSAATLLLFLGRVAGISGIVGGLLRSGPGDRMWRACFVAGLLAGGVCLRAVRPESVQFGLDRSALTIVMAGLLIGYGARLGSGCTSGHGVCGVARGSRRSVLATATFMLTGMATVLMTRLLWGSS